MTSISPIDLEDYNQWRVSRGMAALPPATVRRARSVQVSDEAWYNCQEVAAGLGYANTRGRTASLGSVSELLEALGHGLIQVDQGPSD